jgi:hypothetical protein
MMETAKIINAGSWDSHKAKLKKRFANITEKDLNYEAGKSDDMFNQLMYNLGKNRKEMAAIVAVFYLD